MTSDQNQAEAHKLAVLFPFAFTGKVANPLRIANSLKLIAHKSQQWRHKNKKQDGKQKVPVLVLVLAAPGLS